MNLLHRPVCDLLGCDYPIVLAGMGGVARSELVNAVNDAGGFGFLGMVREPVALIRAEVERVRRHGEHRFGVNLIPAATPADLLAAQIDACIELRVPVIALFWDVSRALIERLRGAGITVVCQVGSLAEAQAAEQAGAQIVIAQGVQAGGHVRATEPLETWLADAAHALSVPLLASGGIVDGHGMASMMALGAQGVVVGTAFIATHEAFAHDYHKQRLVAARSDDAILSDAFHINWPLHAPVRVLANSVTAGAHGDPFGETRVIGDEEGRPIHLFSTDSPLRSMRGDFEAMALYAGQGVGAITRIDSAGDVLLRIANEAAAALDSGAPRYAEPAGFASPPCFLHELGDARFAGGDHDALIAALNVLLEAERAGARVAMRTAAECEDPARKSLVVDIQRDEARWCGVLTQAILRLGGTPSRRTGDFHDKAMAIPDVDARLAFLNRGQQWVVKRLRERLAELDDDILRGELTAMLDAHVRNIDRVQTQLDAAAP